MNATHDTAHWHEQDDDPDIRIDGRVDPDREDAYWSTLFRTEPYYRAGLDYEDYAPAYCVGYIGFAQYGGSLDDAERSLCANWLRIRGGSRLELEQALPAIRAAWRHAEAVLLARSVPQAAKPRAAVLHRPVPAVEPVGAALLPA